MFIQKRRIVADTEMEPEVDTELEGGEEGAVVAPEASDLLFEAEDVAELIAEVTGEAVEVTADDTTVVFAVGEDEYTVEAEGDEEVLEAVRKPFRGKKAVSASTRRPASRSAAPARATNGRVVRNMPKRK